MIKKISIIVALLIIGVNISAQTLNLNNKFNVQSEEIDEKEKMSQDLIVVNKLIEVEKNDKKKADLYILAGNLCFDLRKFQDAVDNYCQSLEYTTIILESKVDANSKVYINRALSYVELDDYDSALGDLDSHLNLLENYDDFKEMRIIYLTKSKCYSLKSDFESASKELSNYLDLDDSDVEVLIRRGLTYGALEKFKEAIYDFTKVINTKSNVSKIQRAQSYKSRGEAKNQLKDVFGAMEDLNMAILLAPSLKASYLVRGNIYFNKKNYSLALKDYNKVLSIDNNDIDALINRAKIKLKLNDRKGGCLDLSRAGELGSDEAYELIEVFCN